jgi:hypothetical protein
VKKKLRHPLLLVLFVALLGFFFAMVEIQIEGAAGWAGNLPTWRIERHWLLDVFWSGRPLTGYHLWVFSFMALVFHLPVAIGGQWSKKLEARILATLMIFWIMEDFLWFVLNPAYGAGRFFRGEIEWHKHIILGLPHDYWIFLILGALLTWYSFRPEKQAASQ